MDPLLAAILERRKTHAVTAGGIVLASDHMELVIPCTEETACNLALHEDVTSEQWMAAVKKAQSNLVYSNRDCQVVGSKSATKILGEDVIDTPTDGACLDYITVLTSINEDRDEDVMHPKGANIDQKMPLLYHHNPVWPIGKFVKESGRNDRIIKIHNAVADTVMGNDAAKLVEFGALRTSHGFKAKKFKERKGGGYEILEYDVFESSLVPIPANADAVITLHSRGKLHHAVNKSWADQLKSKMPTQVVGGFDSTKEHKTDCGCKTKSAARFSPKPTKDMGIPARISYDGAVWVGVTLADSWEWVMEELEEAARPFLASSGIRMREYAQVCLLGTFDDSAVVCVSPSIDDSEEASFYRLSWSMTDSEPAFSGTPQSIELAVQVVGGDAPDAKSIKSVIDGGHRSKALSQSSLGKLKKARALMASVKDAAELKEPTRASAESAHGMIHSVVSSGKSSPLESVAELCRELRSGGTLDAGAIDALREEITAAEERNLSAELAALSN